LPFIINFSFQYGSKQDLPTQEIRVLAFHLQSICTEYGVKTRLAKSDEISVLDFDMHHIGLQYRFRKWVAANENARIFALDLKSISVKYVLET
jgi:hypothetical protein